MISWAGGSSSCKHRRVRPRPLASLKTGIMIETSGTTQMERNNLAFYDRQAAQWWDETATIFPLSKLNPLRFQFFDRYVPDWHGLQVLDVGCGGGYTCEFLAQRGAVVTGLDQSAACIATAQQHARQMVLARRSSCRLQAIASISSPVSMCWSMCRVCPPPLWKLAVCSNLVAYFCSTPSTALGSLAC